MCRTFVVVHIVVCKSILKGMKIEKCFVFKQIENKNINHVKHLTYLGCKCFRTINSLSNRETYVILENHPADVSYYVER